MRMSTAVRRGVGHRTKARRFGLLSVLTVLSSMVPLVTGAQVGLADGSLPAPTFPVPMSLPASASGSLAPAAQASTSSYSAAALTPAQSSPAPVYSGANGWSQANTSTSPPQLDCAMTAFDPVNQNVMLVGGMVYQASGSSYVETAQGYRWTFDGSTWTNTAAVSGGGGNPGGNNGGGSTGYPANAPVLWGAGVAAEANRKDVILYGGEGSGAQVSSPGTSPCKPTSPTDNSTRIWDGTSWSVINANNLPCPGPRDFPAMVYYPKTGTTLLFGGESAGSNGTPQPYGDTWTWDGSVWTQQHPATSPPATGTPAAAYDPTTNTVVLLTQDTGGADTWLWDGSNWTLAASPTTGLAPPNPTAIPTASLTYDPSVGGLVLYEAPTVGTSQSQNVGETTWVWDGQNRRWLAVDAGIAGPTPAGATAQIVYDSVHSNVVLFDGTGGNASQSGSTWVWTPSAVPFIKKSVDRGGNGLYSSGQVATYQIQLGTLNAEQTKSVVAVQDALPPALTPMRGSVTLNGTSCTATSVPACVFNGNTLQVSGISTSPLAITSIAYQAVATGVARACSIVSNAASATNTAGTVTASIPIEVCDTGLGFEAYWQYVTTPVGPQATASVNVANGNLVLQQQDSTTVGAHGRLAYVLRRTYNSEDNLLVSFPGSIGAGWVLNLADTGDGLSDVSAAGLYVPSAESLANAAGITLVDRDGTRHVFTPRAVSLTGTVGGAPVSTLGPAFAPRALTLDSGYASINVDTLYDAPAGVHLGMWRYVELPSSCSPTACAGKVLGYAAVRPDRVRLEFTADGRQVDMMDGNANEFRYVYEASPPAGTPFPRLLQVYEPRSCSLPLASTCRSFTFSYPTSQTVAVIDPAGRTTTYHLDTATPAHLTSVDNPDGTHLTYGYGTCGGTANQLCSATDPRGGTTSFTYSTVSLGLPRIAQVTDRDGNATHFTYSTSDLTANLSADIGTERRRYSGIDDTGRVGQLDQGTTADLYSRHTTYGWDGTGATCVRPSGRIDNQLCQVTRSALTSATPDETASFTYNDEGRMLSQAVAVGGTVPTSLTTTWGYHAQYYLADGTVQVYDDAVAGGGQVTSAGPVTGRTSPTTLFAISDQTQQLTPRGNAAGSAFAPYLTTDRVDDDSAVNPNAVPPTGGTCSNPSTPVANTGNICEVAAPFNGSNPAVTLYTYDVFGQKATRTTPKAVAEGGATPPAFTYTYYQDGDLDLSSSVSSGGWLKAVTDPYGHYVLFAYDRAGNVVRSYERNATAGHTLTDSLASYGSGYAQTLYGSGSTALSAPWRYLVSSTDPLGNTTSYVLDADGNRTTVRPPRGNASGGTAYDTLQTFDANGNLMTVQLPVQTGNTATKTSYTYDQYGNKASRTDANGNVTVYTYDAVNRLTGTLWTRGAWPTPSTDAPAACRQSGSADAPIPAGRILCSTAQSYDGVDNVTAAQDGNHQTTTFTYDGAHRRLTQVAPRFDGSHATLTTAWVYDADGNVTDTCPPNQALSSVPACTSASIYGTHSTYDPAGHRLTVTTFRTAGGAADTTTTTYDADGYPTQVVDPNGHATTGTYDFNDRRTSETKPRDASTSLTTTWVYDPSGNTTAVVMPAPSGATRITAYSYDADNRVVDTVQGADNTVAASAGPASSDGGSDIRTRVMYDPDGHVVAMFAPAAFVTAAELTSPDASFMVRRDYDADGRPTAEYVPRYDSGAHSDLGLTSTQTTQCPTGVAATQSVPNVPSWPAAVGICTTKLQYDAAGNPTEEILPTSNGADNRFVTYTYTDDNLLSTVCSPDPSNGTSGCGAGNSARVTSMTALYDGDGKQVKSTDALHNGTVTSYFSDGLTNQQTAQPNGAVTHVTTYAYDGNGNQTQVTDPLGLSTTTAYFSDNLVSSITDSAGDVTSYVYDPAGNRITVTSPSANAHDTNNASGTPSTYTYTFDNLVATATQPISPDGSLRRETVYGYDVAGRKTSQQILSVSPTGQTTADGGTLTFTYFNDDRQNTQAASAGGSITTAYTPGGQPVTVADTTSGGSTVTASYYLDGTVRTVDDGGRTSQMAYDGLGSIAALSTLVDGTSTKYSATYAYGDSELPASMADTSVTGTGSTSWTYDAAGRPVQETDPNGEKTSWTFNPDATLASLHLVSSTGTNLATWSYLYDSDYRTTQQQFSGQGAGGTTPQQSTFCYHYDAASRLDGFQMLTPGASCGSVPSSISHDHDGNRLTYVDPNDPTHGVTQYTYNADDSIASMKHATDLTPTLFSYTPAGGLASDGCVSNSYDGFYRLSQYQSAGGSNCPSVPSTSLAYDGLDRQRQSGATAVHFVGLTSTIAAETTAGVDTAYEVTTSGQPMAVALENGSPAPQYLAEDGHGNVAGATTVGQGIACTVRFDPYGEPVAPASSTNPCNTGTMATDLLYAGARRESGTGTYQFGARTFDPSKASFLTPDSYRSAAPSADLGVGTDPLTANRYSYVNGDPVNLVDPTGHNPCSSEGTGADGCSPSANRALSASDRGAVISNAWTPTRTYQGPETYYRSPRGISDCPKCAVATVLHETLDAQSDLFSLQRDVFEGMRAGGVNMDEVAALAQARANVIADLRSDEYVFNYIRSGNLLGAIQDTNIQSAAREAAQLADSLQGLRAAEEVEKSIDVLGKLATITEVAGAAAGFVGGFLGEYFRRADLPTPERVLLAVGNGIADVGGSTGGAMAGGALGMAICDIPCAVVGGIVGGVAGGEGADMLYKAATDEIGAPVYRTKSSYDVWVTSSGGVVRAYGRRTYNGSTEEIWTTANPNGSGESVSSSSGDGS